MNRAHSVNREETISGQSNAITAQSTLIPRRSFIAGAAATAAAALPVAAFSQQRDYGKTGAPTRYPDPDILILDKRFGKYKVGTGGIERLYTGMPRAGRPARDRAGHYPGLGRY